MMTEKNSGLLSRYHQELRNKLNPYLEKLIEKFCTTLPADNDVSKLKVQQQKIDTTTLLQIIQKRLDNNDYEYLLVLVEFMKSAQDQTLSVLANNITKAVQESKEDVVPLTQATEQSESHLYSHSKFLEFL